MSSPSKLLFIAAWLFIGLPALAALLIFTLQILGLFLIMFLVVFWCWQAFAYEHYQHARQHDFLHVLQTAAETQAPVERVLNAYLSDRPRQGGHRVWVNALLLIAFPGFYWSDVLSSFDDRLQRLVDLLERGFPLDRALARVPGLASRETALAVTVGQFGGSLPQALKRLPDSQRSPQLIELATRLLYPLLVMVLMGLILSFIMIFIIPKFEKIFLEFRMKLPWISEMLIAASRWFVKYWYVAAFFGWLVVLLFGAVLFSSRARWYCPLVGRLYQMYARGQFLQVLGLMLETGKPLPEILDYMLASNWLPTVLKTRGDRLVLDLLQGQPLAESLVRHELATASMQGLISSAEKMHNLPWALQELGETLIRRCYQLAYRIGIVVFPLAILACACVVGVTVVGIFIPLPNILEGLAGQK